MRIKLAGYAVMYGLRALNNRRDSWIAASHPARPVTLRQTDELRVWDLELEVVQKLFYFALHCSKESSALKRLGFDRVYMTLKRMNRGFDLNSPESLLLANMAALLQNSFESF